MRIVIPSLPALSHPDRKPQKAKLPFIGIDCFGLCLIQGKLHPLKYLPQHCHWTFGAVPTQYYDIVRIADDSGTYSLLQLLLLPYPVQLVQVEVGQQRRDDSALRCAFAITLAAANCPFFFHPCPLP